MPLGAHITAKAMEKVERAGNVGMDDAHGVVEILVEKTMSQSPSGIGEQRLNRAVLTGCHLVEAIEARGGRKIGFHRLDRTALATKHFSGLVNAWFVRG